MIENIVTEELGQLDEGFWRGLWNVAKGAAGMVVNPYGTVGNMFSNPGKSGSGFRGGGGSFSRSSKRSGSSKRQGSQKKKQEKYSLTGGDINNSYGSPEVVPVGRRRVKLEKKTLITAPPRDEESNTGCSLPWGNFGRHYHDKGDVVWNQLISNQEAIIIRKSEGNEKKMGKLLAGYKRILINWLNERDKAYEAYIKRSNKT